jgi:hypothetical protein
VVIDVGPTATKPLVDGTARRNDTSNNTPTLSMVANGFIDVNAQQFEVEAAQQPALID